MKGVLRRTASRLPGAAVVVALAGAAAATSPSAAAGPGPAVPAGPPAAVLDLTKPAELAVVEGTWRQGDAQLVPVQHRAPDAEGQPTGAPVGTFGIRPAAGWAHFDDSAWPVVPAGELAARHGNGRVSFTWWRLALTVPERIGGVETAGAALVFDTVVDDYAEVWVDGELPRGVGQAGGPVVAGWNVANRVIAARSARPGQRIQIAVFGANGPLSDPPANFVWLRSARLELHRPGLAEPAAYAPREVNFEVVRLDPALDAIVPANPKLHKLADGFQFLEGPVWVPSESALLFSDPNANRIYRYDPAGQGSLAVFREKSGYDGADIAEYRQPGSNGLGLDAAGRLTVAEHGRRRIARLGPDGSEEVLADRFEGKRLNSPNDLVWRSDGTLYFSDPPFGLPAFHADPRRELDVTGVFAWKEGRLRLLESGLQGPNGVALSPDERFLYVANWDPQRKVLMRYELDGEGALRDGRVFFDMTGAPGEEALDGVEVDQAGNLYVSGPGGTWILSPEGRHLGTLRGPQLAANFAWGDADGRSLYWTARSGLYRIRLGIPGARR